MYEFDSENPCANKATDNVIDWLSCKSIRNNHFQMPNLLLCLT